MTQSLLSIRRVRQVGAVVALAFSTLAAASLTECAWDPLPPLLRQQSCPLILEPRVKEERPGKPASWTHSPFCDIIRVPPEYQPTKFCLTTSSTFNSDTGISLISIPDSAASIIGAIKHPTATWKERQHLPQRYNASTVAYEIRNVPGKGKGVVATRRIPQFEAIMIGFPALVIDDEFMKNPEDAFFDRAVWQLVDRQRVTTLAHSQGRKMHAVEDNVRTNAFGIHINGRGHRGLYPEIARINHGCDPNAMTSFKADTLAMKVVATRDIQAGEEIQISYILQGIPRAYRLQALEGWGFTCTCSLCTAPAHERTQSDERRERILELLHKMADETISHSEVVSMAKEFDILIEKERFTGKLPDFYNIFMMLFNERGDLESSLKYGRMALMYAEQFGDPEDGMCRGIRDYLRMVEAKGNAM